jgi:hypothetical protein
VDEHCLLLYPFSVEFAAFLLKFFAFSEEIHELVLVWVLPFIVGFTCQLVVELVQPADLMLLFLVDIVPLLNLDLIGNYQIFLIVLFSQSLLPLFGEQLNLGFSVELVDLDPRNFVHNIFILDFLLLDVVVELVRLLQ